jgi:hypothetical protein
MPHYKFIVQVTTLPDCDDITRFDGIWIRIRNNLGSIILIQTTSP